MKIYKKLDAKDKDNKDNKDNKDTELDVSERLSRESCMSKLCECPEVKNQPKYTDNKDPKDSRNYNINNWPIFTPIVPVK